MKILRIQLHPFGGATDRTIELHDGLNMIEGPNEFGKSTLNHALWHALFTPSNLTPARLKSIMGRWYPKPSGDHARVTLEFEAEGRRWSLTKCWGAGASSSLRSDAGPIADPASVQSKLAELLVHNEATWRHVLFVSQAQLGRTLDELREQSDKIDDLEPLLAGAAAIPGDIPIDRLAAAIDARIDQHFSRWDQVSGGPERGRGIENPWVNNVGVQLRAYYAKEGARQELDVVVTHEKEVDRIHTAIRELEESVRDTEAFVREGKSLRHGLAKREGLEERHKRLEKEYTHLRHISEKWPEAKGVITTHEAKIKFVEEKNDELSAELQTARKREAAEQARANHDRLARAREAWKQAEAKAQGSKPVPAEALAELKTLQKEEDNLRIQIAAQKLNARLEGSTAITVHVTRGTQEPETIHLSPGIPWESEAEGKIAVTSEDLSIEIASGTGNVESLFAQLEGHVTRRQELLSALGFDDLAAAERANTDHQSLVQEASTARKLYESALNGKTEEAWAAEIRALEALPSTRSVADLEDKQKAALTEVATLKAEIDQTRQTVEAWETEYKNPASLTDLIVQKDQEIKAAREDLAQQPELPPGFADVATYIAKLNSQEQAFEEATETIRSLRIEQAKRAGVQFDRSAEEIREDLSAKERAFDRASETGAALLRIRAKLDEVASKHATNNPLEHLEEAISTHFHDLTHGRYKTVSLDGGAPVEVVGSVTLGTGLLSQGTLGSLALATRLALAELYLGERSGFLILDDPFTDMDPKRREAAGLCLGKFAQARQVLFFTCHPEHAKELERTAGGASPVISNGG